MPDFFYRPTFKKKKSFFTKLMSMPDGLSLYALARFIRCHDHTTNNWMKDELFLRYVVTKLKRGYSVNRDAFILWMIVKHKINDIGPGYPTPEAALAQLTRGEGGIGGDRFPALPLGAARVVSSDGEPVIRSVQNTRRPRR